MGCIFDLNKPTWTIEIRRVYLYEDPRVLQDIQQMFSYQGEMTGTICAGPVYLYPVYREV